MLVKGYFSVFGNIDAYGEVVDPGAFTDWIRENPSKALPVYWDHDHLFMSHEKPIGVTTTIREDSRGAYFEARLADTPKAAEVGQLVAMGAARQTSFAFRTIDKYKSGDVWHLARLAPSEVTITAMNAANPLAYVEPLTTGEAES